MDRRVSTGRRVAARLIDGTLELGVGGLLAVLWIEWAVDVDDSGWSVIGLLLVAVVIAVAAVAAYEIGFLAWAGKTPGKAMVGIRVVPVDGGERVGLARAAVRVLPLVVIVVPVIGYMLAGAAYGWCLVDADGRGIHDRLAGTVVVDDRPPDVTSPGG